MLSSPATVQCSGPDHPTSSVCSLLLSLTSFFVPFFPFLGNYLGRSFSSLQKLVGEFHQVKTSFPVYRTWKNALRFPSFHQTNASILHLSGLFLPWIFWLKISVAAKHTKSSSRVPPSANNLSFIGLILNMKLQSDWRAGFCCFVFSSTPVLPRIAPFETYNIFSQQLENSTWAFQSSTAFPAPPSPPWKLRFYNWKLADNLVADSGGRWCENGMESNSLFHSKLGSEGLTSREPELDNCLSAWHQERAVTELIYSGPFSTGFLLHDRDLCTYRKSCPRVCLRNLPVFNTWVNSFDDVHAENAFVSKNSTRKS